MASYPRPSAVNYGEGNLKGFTAEQPATHPNGKPEIRDGKSLLKANAPGKLNENRSTSLRPSHKTK